MSEKNTIVKKVYNYSLLELCMKRDGTVSIGDYSKLGEYGSGGKKANITYKCICKNIHTKPFILIEKSGALCKICMHKRVCSTLNAGRTQENRDKALLTVGDPNRENSLYNRKSLDEYMIRDKATLIDSNYSILIYNTLIKFICKCGKKSELPFYDIAGRTEELRNKGYCGALCEKCNKERWIEARNNTNLIEHGKLGGINQTDESRQKGVDTCMEKYGVPSPNQAESVKAKKVETYISTLGVDNPMKDPTIFQRCMDNAKSLKEYKMPSGTIRIIQGYEPQAHDILLKDGFTEEQIISGRGSNIPIIDYLDDNGKSHRHYPDIFIPHQNRIIEIKSTRTFNLKGDSVIIKKEAGINKGFNYEIWILDIKGNILQII